MEDAGFVLLEDWQVGWYIPWVGEVPAVESGDYDVYITVYVRRRHR
jgi:hypothetical protein